MDLKDVRTCIEYNSISSAKKGNKHQFLAI